MSMFNVNIYIKNKTLIAQRFIFRFLPNPRIHNIYNKYNAYIFIYIYICQLSISTFMYNHIYYIFSA